MFIITQDFNVSSALNVQLFVLHMHACIDFHYMTEFALSKHACRANLITYLYLYIFVYFQSLQDYNRFNLRYPNN